MNTWPTSSFHAGPSIRSRELNVGGETWKRQRRHSQPFDHPNSCQHQASRNGLTGRNLVQRATNDDPNTQAELFRAYATTLYRVAFRILRNREDAEDAVQNCWLSALANLWSFKDRSSLSTWLTRILINSALMILRKRRKGCELSLDGTDDALNVALKLPNAYPYPEESLLDDEEKKILELAIRELRPRIRVALELAQLRELSVKETARSLGISLAAAKARLFHARAALRKSPTLVEIARTQILLRAPASQPVKHKPIVIGERSMAEA